MDKVNRVRITDRHLEEPSLSAAIVAVMKVREMRASDIAAKMESGRNRATLYRILSGATQDPKISTFVDICRALEVSPIEVLQLANIVRRTPRDTDLLDVRLRQIFRRIQVLPQDLKRLAVNQVSALADTMHEHRAGDAGETQRQATVADGEAEESVPTALLTDGEASAQDAQG